MSESLEHAKLIELIILYLGKVHAEDHALTILDERSRLIGAPKPPHIDGFVPDVYAFDTPNTFTLIGEAKTARDLETKRSELQIIAFYKFLSTCANGTLIIATEWNMLATTKAVMRSIQHQCPALPVEILVLNDMMMEPFRLSQKTCL